MRAGLNGSAPHRAACPDCGGRLNRYLQRRTRVGLSPAEQAVVARAWALLSDRAVSDYKARALLLGDVERPRGA